MKPLDRVKGDGNKARRTSDHRRRGVNIGEKGIKDSSREFDKGFDALMAASVVRATRDQEAQWDRPLEGDQSVQT